MVSIYLNTYLFCIIIFFFIYIILGLLRFKFPSVYWWTPQGMENVTYYRPRESYFFEGKKIYMDQASYKYQNCEGPYIFVFLFCFLVLFHTQTNKRKRIKEKKKQFPFLVRVFLCACVSVCKYESVFIIANTWTQLWKMGDYTPGKIWCLSPQQKTVFGSIKKTVLVGESLH